MAKEEKDETKTPKEKKTRDDKKVHGVYQIIAAPSARIAKLKPVMAFERSLWGGIKRRDGKDVPAEVLGVAVAATKHNRVIHEIELLIQEAALNQNGLPIEVYSLYDRYINSFRQDLKTLQAIKIAAKEKGEDDIIDIDPLDELQKAEDRMKLTTEQTIKKRKADKAQRKKAKSQVNDTEGESPT